MNIERVMNIKYLYEFDRYVFSISLSKVRTLLIEGTRELQGPTWGYPTENAYYRDASSSDSLLAIRIPLFAIHAEDDPVSPCSFV